MTDQQKSALKPNPSQKRWTLISTILASGSVFLSTSVLNVALPAIDRSLQAGFSGLQWIVDGFLLTLASLLILGGALGDIFGKRRVMLIGLFGFSVTSLFCGLAPSTPWLIAGRVLQGIAGALLVPGSLALIRSVYQDKEQRGNAIGAWSGWSGISTVIGPLIGGWLVAVLSWRWAFFINLPLLMATGFIIWRYVPEISPAEGSRSLDIPGALSVTLGLAGIAYGLIEGPTIGWDSPSTLAALALGTVSLGIFPWIESRTSEPMVPLQLFSTRNFTGANLATFGVYAALQGSTFILVIYIQNIMGFSPLQSGLMLAPISLILLVLSPRMGRLAGQHGPRLFMTIGPLVTALGLGLMTLLHPDSMLWQELIPMIAVFGLGMAITVAPLTNTVMSAVAEERSGIAAAINNMVSRVAGLIAIALIGIAVTGTFSRHIQDRINQLELSNQMESQLREISENPTAGSSLNGLSSQAARAYETAFTSAFRSAMALNTGLAGLGGVLSFALIRNQKQETPPSGRDDQETIP